MLNLKGTNIDAITLSNWLRMVYSTYSDDSFTFDFYFILTYIYI
jgi:hypothetical protein